MLGVPASSLLPHDASTMDRPRPSPTTRARQSPPPSPSSPWLDPMEAAGSMSNPGRLALPHDGRHSPAPPLDSDKQLLPSQQPMFQCPKPKRSRLPRSFVELQHPSLEQDNRVKIIVQPSRLLNSGIDFILAGGLSESRRANGEELTFGLQELQTIVEHKNKDVVPPKQKELI